MEAKQWSVNVYITESADNTHVRAVLSATAASAVGFEGNGHARLHPRDPRVPEVGDELAVGRALIDLGSQLVRLADMNIGGAMQQR